MATTSATRYGSAVAIVFVLTAGLVLADRGAAHAAGCDPTQIRDDTCSVSGSVGDGSVTLEGRQTTPGDGSGPGSQGDASDEGSSADSAVQGDEGSAAPIVAPPCTMICPRDTFGVTMLGPVTVADIAQFRPTPAVDHSQPNGWAIIGLDTNFYTTGDSVQTVDGTLLGQSATVRSTPARWRWVFSDGTTNTTTTGGAPWAGREQEFDPTPTSHVFRTRGTHTISLTVDYTAEFQLAGQSTLGWGRISGLVSVPTNTLTVTAGTAKTVLVAENCNQNPHGPGC